MKKSLQQIEDQYISLGLRGERLRKALKKDKEYQRWLKRKREKLSKESEATKQDRRKYVLAADVDFGILGITKALLKKKVSKEDRRLIALIKSQLLEDWRAPLVQELNRLQRKYR